MNQRGYYSRKVRAGKRTYFFDVRATRSGDFFMTITESKKRHNDSGFDNHKVFIYKEDFHKFIHAMKEGLEHIHSDLSELDVQDFSTKSFDVDMEDTVEQENNQSAEEEDLSEDLNSAIHAQNEENPQSW